MGGAWFVGKARWRRQWRQLLFVGVIAGIVGGAVLGSLAGARRTTSAYGRLLRAARSPHEVLFVFDHADEVARWAQESPLVDHVASGVGMIGRRQPSEDWYSVDAVFDMATFGTSQAIQRGRLPYEGRSDEVFITLRTSKNTGLDVGDEVSFRAYNKAQNQELLANPWTPPAGEQIKLKIVGVARDPSDAQLSQTIKLLFGTPAFARAHRNTTTFTPVFVWLKDGPTRAAEVRFEQELAPFARGLPNSVMDIVPSRDDAQAADNSAQPVAVGLLIFAAVAAVAGLITIMQTLRRSLAVGSDEGIVLAALGAGRGDRVLAQMIANFPFVAVGAVVAVVTCVASSPFFPLGATRSLEPVPGLRVDALVLGVGGLAWLLVLIACAAVAAWSDASETTRIRTTRARRLGDVTSSRALPVAIGARFALRGGARRTARRQAAFASVVVAVAGVVASLVFTQSLRDFTSTPRRFGLGYDLTLELPSSGAQQVFAQLARDEDVSDVAEMRSGPVTLDGRTVSGSSVDARKGTIPLTVGTGVLPRRDDEIAIGPKLLSSLHKRIGSDVDVDAQSGTRKFHVVGTVFSPVSEATAFNEEAVFTAAALQAISPFPGTNALVRVRPGANLRAVTTRLDAQYPYAVSDESRAHAPGPVRNLEQVARLPLALALFFALLGAAAAAQAIFMTANEQRRDIAVLRGLGFTRRQVRDVLLGVAGSVAAVALVLGTPAGYLIGIFGWRAIADGLYVAPNVAIPVAALALVMAGLLLWAGVVAWIPARLAVRRRPGVTLRAE